MPLTEDKECYEAMKPVSIASKDEIAGEAALIASGAELKQQEADLLSSPGDADQAGEDLVRLRGKAEVTKANLEMQRRRIMESLDQDNEDYSDTLSDVRKEYIADREAARENLKAELKRLFPDREADRIFRKFGKQSRAEVESCRIKDGLTYKKSELKSLRDRYRILTGDNATEKAAAEAQQAADLERNKAKAEAK